MLQKQNYKLNFEAWANKIIEQATSKYNLNEKELEIFIGNEKNKSLTIVPISVYNKNRKIYKRQSRFNHRCWWKYWK